MIAKISLALVLALCSLDARAEGGAKLLNCTDFQINMTHTGITWIRQVSIGEGQSELIPMFSLNGESDDSFEVLNSLYTQRFSLRTGDDVAFFEVLDHATFRFKKTVYKIEKCLVPVSPGPRA